MVHLRRPRITRTGLLIAAATAVVALGLMQLVPYRIDNPPVKQEPAWASARTRELTVAACFDCHSNETQTYWFEDIAPLSWWITSHVDDGRSALNFSECVRGSGENEASETLREGSMPPDYYTWFGLHADAELTAQERAQLADGLRTTLQGWKCGSGD